MAINPIVRYDYFYDEQVRRYLMQVVRAFSGFQYMTGDRGVGKPGVLRTVPCTTAKRSRQVAAIQRNMSENTLLTVPMISVNITAFEPDRERMQNVNHIDTLQVTERAKDIVTGEYTGARGNSVTIERLMPRPFELTVAVDIWTSNMDQKFQLIEQISTVIFPGFDIQNSDNALDWSALTTATFESLEYSTVSMPIGTEDEIDVATFVLKIPMWLTPPARVTKQNIIQQIITNVAQGEKNENGVLIATNDLARVITTPGDHCLHVERGFLRLLGPTAQEFNPDGESYAWTDLLAQYGTKLFPGETQIRLRSTLSEDNTTDVVGVIFPTDDPNVVQWSPDIDTLPANTIRSIDGVINTATAIPGEGPVPSAIEGRRFLLNGDLAGFPGDHTPPQGSPQTVWNGISARSGSIIQFTNGKWVVSFNSVDHNHVEYVTNKNTARQLVWNVDEQVWVMALDAVYAPGYWRLGTI